MQDLHFKLDILVVPDVSVSESPGELEDLFTSSPVHEREERSTRMPPQPTELRDGVSVKGATVEVEAEVNVDDSLINTE